MAGTPRRPLPRRTTPSMRPFATAMAKTTWCWPKASPTTRAESIPGGAAPTSPRRCVPPKEPASSWRALARTLTPRRPATSPTSRCPENQRLLVKALAQAGKPLVLILTRAVPRSHRRPRAVGQGRGTHLPPGQLWWQRPCRPDGRRPQLLRTYALHLSQQINSLTNYDFKKSEEGGHDGKGPMTTTPRLPSSGASAPD